MESRGIQVSLASLIAPKLRAQSCHRSTEESSSGGYLPKLILFLVLPHVFVEQVIFCTKNRHKKLCPVIHSSGCPLEVCCCCRFSLCIDVAVVACSSDRQDLGICAHFSFALYTETNFDETVGETNVATACVTQGNMWSPPMPQDLRSTWVGPSSTFTGMLGRAGK